MAEESSKHCSSVGLQHSNCVGELVAIPTELSVMYVLGFASNRGFTNKPANLKGGCFTSRQQLSASDVLPTLWKAASDVLLPMTLRFCPLH